MVKILNRNRDLPTEGSAYIGRGSPWGNPFKIGRHGSRAEVCERFKVEVLPTLDVEPLRGKDLVCFCKPLQCHGDAIFEKLYGAS